ncbi:hypothetical protein [Bacillus changyiensis]|uniref:hypothetical protein n=1 Tax=Bacillus changyiensis TaxID=3004103 RepID=UPI00374466C0
MILVSGSICWFIHLSNKGEIEILTKKNEVQKKKIEQLNIRDEGGALKNKKFFEAFFNYNDIDKRYEDIKKLTTNKGYDYAFPSRTDQKHTVSIKSELLSLESYSKKIDDSHELYLNVVELATTANSVTSNQILIVQTTLKKVNYEWMVDEVHVKGNG